VFKISVTSYILVAIVYARVQFAMVADVTVGQKPCSPPDIYFLNLPKCCAIKSAACWWMDSKAFNNHARLALESFLGSV
jgi:hypothetical protein